MISKKYNPDNNEKIPFGLKAEFKKYSITHNPSSAMPGNTLRIKIPKLDENVLIIPGSVHLVFELEISGHTNNTFQNNRNRNLIKDFKLLYGGETIQHLHRYDLFKTFEDLFLPKEKRDNLLKYGISSLDIRKLRVGAGDKPTSIANNIKVLASVHKNKYRILLDHEILNNHGGFYPMGLDNLLLFELRIADVNDIVVYSDTTKTPTFKMKNIELEYSCVTSQELALKTESLYKIGKSFFMKTLHWKKYLL